MMSDPSDYDVCDEHETSFLKGAMCEECIMTNKTETKEGWHVDHSNEHCSVADNDSLRASVVDFEGEDAISAVERIYDHARATDPEKARAFELLRFAVKDMDVSSSQDLRWFAGEVQKLGVEL